MKIQDLYHYPIKGLSPQNLETAQLHQSRGFAFDRFWAFEIGDQAFDSSHPTYLKKGQFVQLLSHPKLALLKCQFNEQTKELSIHTGGHALGQFNLSDQKDKLKLEQIIIEYLNDPKITKINLVSAPNHHFSDIPQAAISLINLASVKDLEKTMGASIDPLRFRGNIHVENLEPWQELNWAGKSIWANGKKIFDVFENIGRCLATHVNLTTGERDLAIKNQLLKTYNHSQCGVYLISTSDTQIAPGMELTVK